MSVIIAGQAPLKLVQCDGKNLGAALKRKDVCDYQDIAAVTVRHQPHGGLPKIV
ncbi:MAG: hypothetical protein RR998_05640 [Oscillospiraceae bacterium]